MKATFPARSRSRPSGPTAFWPAASLPIRTVISGGCSSASWAVSSPDAASGSLRNSGRTTAPRRSTEDEMGKTMGIPDLWCETFDLDLPKVIPGALVALGDTADQVLFTHAAVTNGRINLPAAWNENEGMASYFGFKSPANP